MSDFTATTACSGPLVGDVQAVERVLAGYVLDRDLRAGVAFDFDDGRPHLYLYGSAWPEAWPLPDGIERADFDPDSTDFREHGAEGFVELLKELAPHLAEPLVVQAIGADRCRFPLAAAEWSIDAAGTTVYFNGFDHGYCVRESGNSNGACRAVSF
jgi:hypothetical protein